jgi:hypothetical protein
MPVPLDPWTAAREAAALGVSLREISAHYGLTLAAVRKRAHRERWPRPDALPSPASPTPVTQPSQLAAQSWAERGEMHRAAMFKLASEALAKAKPRRLEDWSDIERAARLADRAAGLDKPAALVSIAFPALHSTESPAVLDVSTDFQPGSALDLPPTLPPPPDPCD